MIKNILLAVLLSYVHLLAQVYSDKDVEISNNIFSFAAEENLGNKSIGDVITEVGKQFIGTDYEAFALEKEGEEQLVVNLTGLDCTTFLENTLVFSRLIKSGKNTFADYQEELINVRYRNSIIEGYPSRLHYFSDWIYHNSRKGIIEDVTKDIGGEKINFMVNIMSSSPDSYKQLSANPEFADTIKKQENEISSREYYYIPKKSVRAIEDKIQNGDLLALTTNVRGLDIGHVGIAVKKEDGRIYFMHAPIAGSKVQVSENPLPEYLSKIKKHTGIVVLRPQEPEGATE